MADNTLIEWARHPVTGKGATWNIVTGCSVVSPGCTNCYAMKLAGTRLKHHESRKGLTRDTKAGPVWTGETRFNEQWLTQPLGWKIGRGIFVAAHGDLFARGVTDAQLDRIFAVMALTPQHIYFVLTKRPERMREYLSEYRSGRVARKVVDFAIKDKALMRRMIRDIDDKWPVISEGDPDWPDDIMMRHWPLPNVWLGVSVEDQPRADERIPILLDTPAAIRFISAEPLLGPIDFYKTSAAMPVEGHPWKNGPILQGLDWVIAGGESGNDARPSHPDWFRSLRDQCAEADVAFFFKQWGSWGRPKYIRPSGTPGKFALATTKVGASEFWPQTVIRVDQWPRQINLFGGASVMEMVGKKDAGHMLDGVEHFAFPEARP